MFDYLLHTEYYLKQIISESENFPMARADSKSIFETLPVPRAVREMALPAIFSQIIVLIYNMADTFYLGRTNDPLMVAGASLILPVFNICIAFAMLTGIGGSSMISRLLGVGREEEARKVSTFSIGFALAIAAAFSVVMGVFMRPILTALGASENIFLYASQYTFCVVVLGGIPTVFSNAMSNILRSAGLSRQASAGVMAGGLINIALDPLFMFVLLPRGQEVLGVGIATLLSNCIASAYFIIILLRERKRTVITFDPRLGMPERASLRSVFSVGVPAAISMLLFDLDYMVINRLMASYSDVALAAIGIVLKGERLPLNTGVGICQGIVPIVAYNFASGNHKRMKETIRYSLRLGLIVGAVSIVLYELFAGQIIHFFIAEPQTMALGTAFLRARILATPLMFCSFFIVHLFQGFGEGGKSLLLVVIRWLILNIPMLFILNHFIGMYGIVWAQVTADVINVIVSVIIFRRCARRAFAAEAEAGKV